MRARFDKRDVVLPYNPNNVIEVFYGHRMPKLLQNDFPEGARGRHLDYERHLV